MYNENNVSGANPTPEPALSEVELADALRADFANLRVEIGKRVLGQEDAVEHLLITLLIGGNSLLMGVPGLAKTLLVQTVADVFDLEFSRIQFTPDLMPSDITGTEVIAASRERGGELGSMEFVPGPLFGNLILADEINRTPPKTQSALLEAMQERSVTVQGKTYALPAPYFVLATQNPIELEGTFPLPEAQLDRFAFEIILDYLPAEDEVAVVKATTGVAPQAPRVVVSKEQLLSYQLLTRQMPIADDVVRYAVNLVRATRPVSAEATAAATQWLMHGASVRAAQFLTLAGKAKALMRGDTHVTPDDIRSLAGPVLRHRLIRTFEAEAERIETSEIVARIVEENDKSRAGDGR